MAGPTPRESYNAKARGSTAGGSRKKGKTRKNERSQVESDPNASLITPKSQEVKESERKEKLLQEVWLVLLISMCSAYWLSLPANRNQNGRAKRRKDWRNI